MTIEQAMVLYEMASGENTANYTDSERVNILAEIEAIVAAKSDRAAARIIQWWGCWDRNYTATVFCRRVREAYKKGLGKK